MGALASVLTAALSHLYHNVALLAEKLLSVTNVQTELQGTNSSTDLWEMALFLQRRSSVW